MTHFPGFGFGGTKEAEYNRTIEILLDKLQEGKTKKDLMFFFYFLYDSQYDNKDLKIMADMLRTKMSKKENIKQ